MHVVSMEMMKMSHICAPIGVRALHINCVLLFWHSDRLWWFFMSLIDISMMYIGSCVVCGMGWESDASNL